MEIPKKWKQIKDGFTKPGDKCLVTLSADKAYWEKLNVGSCFVPVKKFKTIIRKYAQKNK